MQKMPKVAALAVMAKITHHQRGAGCSTTSEMRPVSQLKFRRFKTSGTCAIRCLASSTLSGAAAGAPSMSYVVLTPVPPRPHLQSQYPWRQACSDWGCGDGRDNSFGE